MITVRQLCMCTVPVHVPANMRHWTIVGSILAQHLRRWPSIDPTMDHVGHRSQPGKQTSFWNSCSSWIPKYLLLLPQLFSLQTGVVPDSHLANHALYHVYRLHLGSRCYMQTNVHTRIKCFLLCYVMFTISILYVYVHTLLWQLGL